MNVKIKRFTFYNIFFLCAFFSVFILLDLKSYARTYNYELDIDTTSLSWNGSEYVTEVFDYNGEFSFETDAPNSLRFCIVRLKLDNDPNYTNGRYYIYSNLNVGSISFTGTHSFPTSNGETSVGNIQRVFTARAIDGYYRYLSGSLLTTTLEGNNSCTAKLGYVGLYNIPVFTNLSDAYSYLDTGVVPELPFDSSMELDSLKVKSWQLGTSQGVFKSSFEVTWSNPEISLVQVIIEGVSQRDSFESSYSPFKQKFSPGTYVVKKGDIVHITATPYKSDGTYGVSLYQSFEYDDNIPGSNIYRKFTNTPYSDNTLTIPYTGVSGQPQSVTLPVDGITTNNTYKVNYNPVTYEYGDLNLYEIYYSPVVVYPSDATDEEIDETQEVINNTYTTNNYYETTKNINIDFDVSFGDISGSDIQHGFDDFGNFGNGFGGLLSKLSSWILALFPFLSPVVASSIVVCGGLIIGLAIIVFVLKIASVIADLIPF